MFTAKYIYFSLSTYFFRVLCVKCFLKTDCVLTFEAEKKKQFLSLWELLFNMGKTRAILFHILKKILICIF